MQSEGRITQGNCLLNIAYYKLWAGKHFAYYVIGQDVEGHGVGGAKETLSQALTIPRVYCVWETMRKKPEIVAKLGLCSSRCCGGTITDAMKSDLPDAVRGVVQADHRDSAFGMDKSHRLLWSQLKTFQLSRQI